MKILPVERRKHDRSEWFVRANRLSLNQNATASARGRQKTAPNVTVYVIAHLVICITRTVLRAHKKPVHF